MAQPCATPASYYASIDASVLGAAGLKTALHNLIDDHTVVSYENAWQALAVLDASQSDSSKVIGIYSTHEHDAVADRGIAAGWNREHSWPKSYGVEYSGPDYSDLHALYAADWNVNSARSNLFFDDCFGAGCTSPAHAEAAPSTAKDSSRFMPPTNKRGDLARSMFCACLPHHGARPYLLVRAVPRNVPLARRFRPFRLALSQTWRCDTTAARQIRTTSSSARAPTRPPFVWAFSPPCSHGTLPTRPMRPRWRATAASAPHISTIAIRLWTAPSG